MESEIKIFEGSAVLKRRIDEMEEEFNITIKPTTVSANTYITLNGKIEDLLKFVKYMMEEE